MMPLFLELVVKATPVVGRLNFLVMTVACCSRFDLWEERL
jgi:hypothetical protein